MSLAGSIVCAVNVYMALTTRGRIIGEVIAFLATCLAVACAIPIGGYAFTWVDQPWPDGVTDAWKLWFVLCGMVFCAFGLFVAARIVLSV